MFKETTKELMQRRIRQILVHSCIYYDFDCNIVSDYEYDKWAKELMDLVKLHPQLLKELEFGEYFINYNETSSGFNLPYRQPQIRAKAQYLLELRGII